MWFLFFLGGLYDCLLRNLMTLERNFHFIWFGPCVVVSLLKVLCRMIDLYRLFLLDFWWAKVFIAKFWDKLELCWEMNSLMVLLVPDNQCVFICYQKKSLVSIFYMERLEFPNHKHMHLWDINCGDFGLHILDVLSNFTLIQEKKSLMVKERNSLTKSQKFRWDCFMNIFLLKSYLKSTKVYYKKQSTKIYILLNTKRFFISYEKS